MALAKRLGAKVSQDDIAKLWSRASCAVPNVSVTGKGASDAVTRAVREAFRDVCIKPLSVTVALHDTRTQEASTKNRIAKPLPGYSIQTEEQYVEQHNGQECSMRDG